MKRSVILWAGLLVTACQTYSTVSVAAVPAGATVRVALTDSGAVHVVPELGSRAEQLEGTVSSAEAGGLTIAVAEVTRAGGATELGEGKIVHVRAADVAALQVKTTSVARSIALGGAIVGGSILAGRSLGGGSGSTLRGGGPIKTGQ